MVRPVRGHGTRAPGYHEATGTGRVAPGRNGLFTRRWVTSATVLTSVHSGKLAGSTNSRLVFGHGRLFPANQFSGATGTVSSL